MLIRRLAVENFRSFFERQELHFDDPISIIIGPNGGGKTNLLDALAIFLQNFIIGAKRVENSVVQDGKFILTLGPNHFRDSALLDKHSHNFDADQIIEVTVEVSASDLYNMNVIKESFKKSVCEYEAGRLVDNAHSIEKWIVDSVTIGHQFSYTSCNGILQSIPQKAASDFLDYLQVFEIYNLFLHEIGKDTLQRPMIFLPVTRAGQGINFQVTLANFDERNHKQNVDRVNSRSPYTSIASFAIALLAKKHRIMESKKDPDSTKSFSDDYQVKKITEFLLEIGYNWSLSLENIMNNTYNIILEKQGTNFLSTNASSGEKEIINYVFSIYGLNINNAVIIIDEPELHLHPNWQKLLLNVFEKLSKSTGNQFILATHSPTFISPNSINYVTRVHAENQRSRVTRLNQLDLPTSRHLTAIVNSQNNEKIFFCEKIVLVEGINDRVFFEKVFTRYTETGSQKSIEVVSVGGKNFFPAYEKLLKSMNIKYYIIADNDYLEQLATPEISGILKSSNAKIKRDLTSNAASMDSESFVEKIDKAMHTGDWKDARDVWEHIKLSRRTLRRDLSDEEKGGIAAFIEEKKRLNIHILKCGALEAYLPKGTKSKDFEKLLIFLESPDFWSKLPTPNRDEIEEIALSIISG